MTPKTVVLDAAEVCGGRLGMLGTICTFNATVTNPASHRGYSSEEHPLIPQLEMYFLEAIDTLVQGIVSTLHQRVLEGSAEPHDDMAPVIENYRGFVADKGRKTINLVLRLFVTEAMAKELDALAAAADGKPQGSIALQWAHGDFAQISYDNR